MKGRSCLVRRGGARLDSREGEPNRRAGAGPLFIPGIIYTYALVDQIQILGELYAARTATSRARQKIQGLVGWYIHSTPIMYCSIVPHPFMLRLLKRHNTHVLYRPKL